MSRLSRSHAPHSLFALLPLVALAACANGVEFPEDNSSSPPTYIPPPDPGTKPVALTLGTASTYAILAGSTVSSTGVSEIDGDVGVSPGDQATGLPEGTVPQLGTVAAYKAQADLATAYDTIGTATCTMDLTGKNLGGLKLVPGVYCITGSASLDGDLQLDAQSLAGSAFVFKISGMLTLSESATVKVVNGGSDCNTFWQVGGAVQLSKDSELVGSVLAVADITMDQGASLSGRALTKYGAVTLDTNYVANCSAPAQQ